jgi:hypothetical protein
MTWELFGLFALLAVVVAVAIAYARNRTPGGG